MKFETDADEGKTLEELRRASCVFEVLRDITIEAICPEPDTEYTNLKCGELVDLSPGLDNLTFLVMNTHTGRKIHVQLRVRVTEGDNDDS